MTHLTLQGLTRDSLHLWLLYYALQGFHNPMTHLPLQS